MLDDTWGLGQNALFKIAAKQYLGCLGGRGQNTLFKIAAKQCLGRLMMIDDA